MGSEAAVRPAVAIAIVGDGIKREWAERTAERVKLLLAEGNSW